jgi:hypothetical protein
VGTGPEDVLGTVVVAGGALVERLVVEDAPVVVEVVVDGAPVVVPVVLVVVAAGGGVVVDVVAAGGVVAAVAAVVAGVLLGVVAAGVDGPDAGMTRREAAWLFQVSREDQPSAKTPTAIRYVPGALGAVHPVLRLTGRWAGSTCPTQNFWKTCTPAAS